MGVRWICKLFRERVGSISQGEDHRKAEAELSKLGVWRCIVPRT